MTKGIILCQPDGEKGCSACCGLFNLRDIERVTLEGFLEKGRDRVSEAIDAEPENDAYRLPESMVRDRTSHVCPYQGFLDRGRPGCLLHPAHIGDDRRDLSLFGKKICDEFLCPAHRIIPEHEKGVLINSVKDWYRYSLAIIDPESFLWIVKAVDELCGGVSDPVLKNAMISAGLGAHAEIINVYQGPVFFYSLPEYDLHKKAFSLPYNKENTESVRKRIVQVIDCRR